MSVKSLAKKIFTENSNNIEIQLYFSESCNKYIFELLLSICTYGFKILKIDPSTITDEDVNKINQYFNIIGYKLNVKKNHKYMIYYCKYINFTTEFIDNDIDDDISFLFNKFHVLALFNKTDKRLMSSYVYHNNIHYLLNIKAFSENGENVLYFTKL